jgi:hypothetical protein
MGDEASVYPHQPREFWNLALCRPPCLKPSKPLITSDWDECLWAFHGHLTRGTVLIIVICKLDASCYTGSLQMTGWTLLFSSDISFLDDFEALHLSFYCSVFSSCHRELHCFLIKHTSLSPYGPYHVSASYAKGRPVSFCLSGSIYQRRKSHFGLEWPKVNWICACHSSAPGDRPDSDLKYLRIFIRHWK